MSSSSAFWRDCLNILAKDIGPLQVSMWLKNARLVRDVESDDKVILSLEVGDSYWLSHISLELRKHILEAARSLRQKPVTLELKCKPGAVCSDPPTRTATKSTPAPSLPRKEHTLPNYRKTGLLNPKYTFSSFIEGQDNALARRAALAVSASPKTNYNPLMVWGATGLGKTHLLHAISNAIDDRSVSYVSCSDFVAAFVKAIRDDRACSFSQAYREFDVLIIDDIQFLIGKPKMQEQIIYIFNHLYQDQHQIVISADRPPREMYLLETRLRSQVAGGLVVHVRPPDYETRLAILQQKASVQAQFVPSSILEFIAARITNNVRTLESALNRVVALQATASRQLSLDVVKLGLRDLFNGEPARITPEQIANIVAGFYHIELKDLLSRKRTKMIAEARQIAMYFARSQCPGQSLSSIAKALGRKDHSTVVHGCRVVSERIEYDPSFRNHIVAISQLMPKEIGPGA